MCGFKYFLFSPLFGEDSHFDIILTHIFSDGWFNHQPGLYLLFVFLFLSNDSDVGSICMTFGVHWVTSDVPSRVAKRRQGR